MEFDYSKKESYTQEDLDKIIGQHDGFVKKQFKDFKSAEDYSKVVDELKPFKQAEKDKTVQGYINSLIDDDKSARLIKRGVPFSEDDTQETYQSKVKEFIEEFELDKKVDAGLPVEQRNKKEIKKEDTSIPKTKIMGGVVV